jgi:hypothetical protein
MTPSVEENRLRSNSPCITLVVFSGIVSVVVMGMDDVLSR